MPAARETPPWWLPAAWPAPAQVRAGITTRLGGGSRQKYTGFNLALHVGDDPSAVSANRVELRQRLNLPQEPCWLQQIHGNHVVPAAAGPAQPADGSYTTSPGPVCTILVADCVPLLLADFSGHQVAAIHAGWRGIAAGIVDAALAVMEVECRSRGDARCRWLVGAPDTLTSLYQHMAQGADYRTVLGATAG